ncbi:Acetyl-CoA synthetase-like protein [Dioscorea alata]|uniref:Acetyl-CoA synthetase-like protein n=1 Tax=Dioscorea alata TaxID=55571 RepID=A0ACB7UUS5_DIOAL|nr:Acetyl-CoA synthetase-like protein [Dioscorea alata]
MESLLKCGANYVPLSPITFLPRAASVYSDRTSIIYQNTRFTWSQTYHRCLRLSSALRSLLYIKKNDVVSVLAPNIPAIYEMHFAVPMAGAVLNTINTRLHAKDVAKILVHSEAKVLFYDYEHMKLIDDIIDQFISSNTPLPQLILIDDIDTPTGVVRHGKFEYEELIARGDPMHAPHVLEDEWDAITLNYTSGTTSAPKGVVYSHRGAYISCMTLLLQWGVGNEPVYLWSLPMFHCNGWTFTWGMAARGGTNVCIRNTSAAEMHRAITQHKVTHMCCAPIVLKIIFEGFDCNMSTATATLHRRPVVEILTGGAPPPAALLGKIENLGFHVTHAYGLTEATGPATVCEWKAEWNELPREVQANLKARQGISVLTLADIDVKNLEDMKSVPRDGKTRGEIVIRGSSIMKGYFKNEEETRKAFVDGWFLTGDVGVIHPDGYVEIKDRSKDVIISGGENISSVEVENVLYWHPAVEETAVVAMKHPHWGETPCAFLKLKKEFVGSVKEEEIIMYCRKNMTKFMVPKKVVFMDELPKTATGKIKKTDLREMAKSFKVATMAGRVTQQQRSNKRLGDEPQIEHQVMALSRL